MKTRDSILATGIQHKVNMLTTLKTLRDNIYLRTEIQNLMNAVIRYMLSFSVLCAVSMLTLYWTSVASMLSRAFITLQPLDQFWTGQINSTIIQPKKIQPPNLVDFYFISTHLGRSEELEDFEDH